jgi:hypothetical protein
MWTWSVLWRFEEMEQAMAFGLADQHLPLNDNCFSRLLAGASQRHSCDSGQLPADHTP